MYSSPRSIRSFISPMHCSCVAFAGALMTAHMSIVIVGAGPNLGAAVARRFGREGLAVGLVARNRDKLEALASELTADGITADFATADIRDSQGLSSAIASVADRLGPAEV